MITRVIMSAKFMLVVPVLFGMATAVAGLSTPAANATTMTVAAQTTPAPSVMCPPNFHPMGDSCAP